MDATRLARLMKKSAKAERVRDIRPGLGFPATAPKRRKPKRKKKAGAADEDDDDE